MRLSFPNRLIRFACVVAVVQPQLLWRDANNVGCSRDFVHRVECPVGKRQQPVAPRVRNSLGADVSTTFPFHSHHDGARHLDPPNSPDVPVNGPPMKARSSVVDAVDCLHDFGSATESPAVTVFVMKLQKLCDYGAHLLVDKYLEQRRIRQNFGECVPSKFDSSTTLPLVCWACSILDALYELELNLRFGANRQ